MRMYLDDCTAEFKLDISDATKEQRETLEELDLANRGFYKDYDGKWIFDYTISFKTDFKNHKGARVRDYENLKPVYEFFLANGEVTTQAISHYYKVKRFADVEQTMLENLYIRLCAFMGIEE